jgi:hypothetical protein
VGVEIMEWVFSFDRLVVGDPSSMVHRPSGAGAAQLVVDDWNFCYVMLAVLERKKLQTTMH